MTDSEKYVRIHFLTAPFDQELQRLIDNPPMGSVPLEVTPEMAKEMLKRNTRNRGYRRWRVIEIAKEMSAGNWRDTGATIVFCKSGILGDGQHRLGGCVESGVTMNAQIIFGRPDDSFAYMDMGAKRTAADIFTINGVENAVLMSAATAKVASVRYVWSRGLVAKSPGLTAAQLYDLYLNHIGIQRSAQYGRDFNTKRLLEASLATALHYLCARKNREEADRFFRKSASGLGILKKNDPCARLRERLIDNLTGNSKLPARHKAALVIKAWNNHRAGLSPRRLDFDLDETFPRVG